MMRNLFAGFLALISATGVLAEAQDGNPHANEVKSAEFLVGGAPLVAQSTPDGVKLALPPAATDAGCSTIKLVVQGKPQVEQAPIMADKDGVIRLLANDAHCEGESVRREGKEGEVANIGFWTNPKDIVSWDLRAAHQGKYLLQIEAASASGASVLLVQGVGKLAYSVPKTSSLATYETTSVGEVELAKDARITLTLRPVLDGWNPVNIRKVELIPQP